MNEVQAERSRGAESSEDLDANIGFVSCVPQPGDFVVSDEYNHTSVHDGVHASRVGRSHRSFDHISVTAIGQVLEQIISEKKGADMGGNSVFVAVEGDRGIGGGALSRGKWILVAVEVSHISLSNPTFTDPRTAVLVTSTLIRGYMINYARSFIYTQLSTKVLKLSTYLVDSLRRKIVIIPPSILSFLTAPQHHAQHKFSSPLL